MTQIGRRQRAHCRGNNGDIMHTSISGAWFAASITALAFNIVFPVVLAVVLVRRFRERFRFVWYGALIFFLFQIATRVPLITVAQVALARTLQSSTTVRWAWLFVLALSAGLFEEIGRYIGYRWLLRRDAKTWEQGVLYGLGHGGIEAIVLVGGLGMVQIVSLVALSRLNLATAPLSPAQQQAVAQQLAAVAAQPWWFPLLGAWERVWAIAFHVALSLVVLQVFWRNQRRWLLLAIVAHFVLNFVSVGLLQLGTNAVLVEGVIAAMGLMALWVIFRLRHAPNAVRQVDVSAGIPTP